MITNGAGLRSASTRRPCAKCSRSAARSPIVWVTAMSARLSPFGGFEMA
jgi:hypothetical protein